MSPRPVPRVGERLREARQRRGVSVRSLARELGVSASLISQIETGKSQPSVSTLYAMTTALGISVEDVFASVPASEVRPARPRRSAGCRGRCSRRWARPAVSGWVRSYVRATARSCNSTAG